VAGSSAEKIFADMVTNMSNANYTENCVTTHLRDRTYDLAVAYRIYPKVSKPAQNLPFGDDKLRQAEVCLRSFRESLGSLRVKMWAILDGCPPEYRALFERYFEKQDLVFVELDRAGNRATFAKQIEILLSQRDAEFVYFAEDDYVYLAGQFQLMIRFLRDQPGVDFISPYDHMDCYRLDLHHGPKWLTVFADHHWRTAASTCLTFLTRRTTLAKYERVFRAFCRKYGDDCALWLSLTKSRVFNPLLFARYFVQRELYWKPLLKAWLYSWPQIIFGSRTRLWVPVPGIATHLSEGLLSPCIDWSALMQDHGIAAREPEACATAMSRRGD
jgi:hypothetical protein